MILKNNPSIEFENKSYIQPKSMFLKPINEVFYFVHVIFAPGELIFIIEFKVDIQRNQ